MSEEEMYLHAPVMRDLELQAMVFILAALGDSSGLDNPAKARVARWVAARWDT